MKNQTLHPATLFLIIGFTFGIALSIFAPFGTGFDEESHLARVYDISGFNLLPNHSIYNKTVSFAEFHSLSYRRYFYRDQGFEVFKPESFLTRANYSSMEIESIMSIYPPLMFFPQAVVAGIGWRLLDMPIIPVAILLRIVGLCVYLLGGYLAIKIIPVGKWALLAVALLPTSLYQAATVNGDGFTNAVSFLFIALVLSHALQPEMLLTRGKLLILCIAIILLGMAKPGAILLFPLIFILPRKVFASRSQLVTLWAVIVAMIIFHVAWIFIGFTNTSLGEGSPALILGSVVTQPGDFLRAFMKSFLIYYQDLFSSMTAAYGYWEGTVPVLVYWIVTLVLILTQFVDEKNERLSRKIRVFMFILMLLAWFGILVMYTSGKFAYGDKNTVLMVQGRYLIAFLPLLLLSLTGLVSVRIKTSAIFKRIIFIGIIVFQGFFFWGLYAHYYTPCGPSVLSHSACRLPAYQNIEIAQPPQVVMDPESSLEQEFNNTCTNIRTVEVLMGDIFSDASGAIKFSLLSEEGRVIASKTFDVSEVDPNQTITLDLSSSDQLIKGNYKIRLEPQDLSGEIGVAIRDRDVYPGSLTLAKTPVEGDMVFYYVCAPVGLFGY